MYPQVFGKYVLERELSRGGMARVVLATLRGAGGFEKKLVVKQIRDELSFDQQFVRRFVEEAKTTVALSHPNIVPVYELGVEQGTYFLAMELVEGCSVAELVRDRTVKGERRVLSPEEGAYVGMEVCRALDYAHRRMKVVHRDITPRNVMIDEEGQVKLIDFGIAAPAKVAGHEILGSPGHMPPEQVDGKELGPPTDIFAVAVLLMEAWSGVAPFRRATPEECEEAMRGPHPRPSDYDPRLIPLDDVISRAMNLDPKKRQENAGQLGRALRTFLQGTDIGDIARALGDRVHDMRQAASDPAPDSGATGAMRAQIPSAGDLGTKTFAAREEAIRWSQPPPGDPLAASGEVPAASTRRLEGSAHPPPAAYREERDGPDSFARDSFARDSFAVEAHRTPRRVPLKDPAMSIPTPLMVEPVGADGAEVLRSARAAEAAAKQAARDLGDVGDLDDQRTPSAPPPRAPSAPSAAASASDSGDRDRDRDPERTVRRKDERLDTLATRPLETPVEVRPSGSLPAKGARSRSWGVIGLAAATVIAGVVVWRARGAGDDARSGAVASAATATASPSAGGAATIASGVATGAPTGAIAPGGGTATAPGTAPTGAVAAPPSTSTHAASTTSGASGGSTAPVTSSNATTVAATASNGGSAAEKPGKALVTFLGDPGTRVSVDGVARGACPVRISLDPGQHDARFSFDPTGESLSEGFRLKGGDKVTVRAEFTGARPTVRVQR